jgi:hypothetical protein
MRYLIIICILILSCNCPNSNNKKVEITHERIKLIAENYFRGIGTYYIIEIDGHEYIGRYQSSLIHSESCKCKDNRKFK